MKYIRTKDKIFETTRLPLERFSIELTKMIDKQVGLPNPHIEEIEILKQADTIEELCDEFVGIDSQGHYIIHNDQWLEGARIIPLEDIEYYGAIWTDKGLQFVARMNSKGELELL